MQEFVGRGDEKVPRKPQGDHVGHCKTKHFWRDRTAYSCIFQHNDNHYIYGVDQKGNSLSLRFIVQSELVGEVFLSLRLATGAVYTFPGKNLKQCHQPTNRSFVWQVITQRNFTDCRVGSGKPKTSRSKSWNRSRDSAWLTTVSWATPPATSNTSSSASCKKQTFCSWSILIVNVAAGPAPAPPSSTPKTPPPPSWPTPWREKRGGTAIGCPSCETPSRFLFLN